MIHDYLTQTEGLIKTSRPMGPMARPDAYNQVMPSMVPPLAAMGADTAYRMSRGGAFGASAMKAMGNPVTSTMFFANPKGRAAQFRADTSYLRNAGNVDMTAGLPKMSSLRAALSRTANSPRVQRGLDALSRFLDVKRPVSPGTQALNQLKGRAGALAIGLPAAMGIMAASQTGLDTLKDTQNRVMEYPRRNRALRRLDMEALHEQGLLREMEDNPERARRELHKTFRILNRYAPTVAKDPDLAAGALTRIAQNVGRYGSGEDYLAQVQRAVDLEAAIQGTRRSPALPAMVGGLGDAAAPAFASEASVPF